MDPPGLAGIWARRENAPAVHGCLTSTWVWQPACTSLGCIPAPQLGVTRFCPGLEEPSCSPSTILRARQLRPQQPRGARSQGWEGDGIASWPRGCFEVPGHLIPRQPHASCPVCSSLRHLGQPGARSQAQHSLNPAHLLSACCSHGSGKRALGQKCHSLPTSPGQQD